MEKFNFSYTDSIKRIKCYYTYGEKIENDSYWEGYIIVRNLDGLLYIEGYENDKMDSLEKNGNPHYRYILGDKAISYADETLVFQVYPQNLAPLTYYLKYNSEDGCFYGNWLFMPSDTHRFPSHKNGKAIIQIEDVLVNDKEIIDIVKKVAERSIKEYSEEIEVHRFISDRINIAEDLDNSNATRRLSMYNNKIKQQ